MSKPPKVKPFLGHKMTKADHGALLSLICMSSLPFGVCKSQIRTEAELWYYPGVIYNLHPLPGEGFATSLHRIRNLISDLPGAARDELRKRAGVTLGVAHVTYRSRKMAARAERAPVVYSHGARASGAKPSPVMTTQRGATAKDDFYRSWEWRTLRMEVIKKFGRSCQCCGATPGQFAASGEPVRICVDHIKPISKRWDLRLDVTNLQILCDECNQGKGAWDATDWRPEVVEEEPPMTPIEVQLGERLRIVGGTEA